MNTENLKKIMDDFDMLFADMVELETFYDDEEGYHHGTVEHIDVDDIRNIFYRLEKELGV